MFQPGHITSCSSIYSIPGQFSHDINSSLARGHAFNQQVRFARELAGWYQNATNTQNSESDKVAHFQGWAVVNSRREKGYKRGRPGNCDLTGQTQTDD